MSLGPPAPEIALTPGGEPHAGSDAGPAVPPARGRRWTDRTKIVRSTSGAPGAWAAAIGTRSGPSGVTIVNAGVAPAGGRAARGQKGTGAARPNPRGRLGSPGPGGGRRMDPGGPAARYNYLLGRSAGRATGAASGAPLPARPAGPLGLPFAGRPGRQPGRSPGPVPVRVRQRRRQAPWEVGHEAAVRALLRSRT
jgi:hypothetical protein